MTAAWDDMAVVGRIARAHGIRGEVVVNPDTDFPERRFRAGAALFIRRGGAIEAVRLTTARMQHGRPIIGIEGVRTMSAAEELAGCELRVPVDELERLPAGSYYHHDLTGCSVETTSGMRLGSVSRVEGAPGGSRLVVEAEAGEVLIPLATDICVSIDVTARVIVVNPPDGLLELNARRSRRPRGAE